MLKQLTPAELSKALSGLSLEEKRELLELLEVREERKPEPVRDDRPPMWRVFPLGGTEEELCAYIRGAGHDPDKLQDGPLAVELMNKFVRDQHAKKSSDPEAFRLAWDAHVVAAGKHSNALYAEAELAAAARGVDPHSLEMIFPVHPQFGNMHDEAKRRATVDGFPDPVDALPTTPASEPDPDPLERLRRASLPKATRGDLEETAARRAEADAFRRAAREDLVFHRPAPAPAPVDEPVDKLADFRGIGPLSYPPAYEDS